MKIFFAKITFKLLEKLLVTIIFFAILLGYGVDMLEAYLWTKRRSHDGHTKWTRSKRHSWRP